MPFPEKKRWIVAAALSSALLWSTPAWVHPHVFAEASLEVKLDPSSNVSALRHVWRFDDLFSSTVLVEFDTNKDLKLDESELAEVSKTIFESLAEYNYFQLVEADGKDVAMSAPDQLIATLEDNQLIVLFESKPKTPFPLSGKIDFGVYDPTFYTAIDFTEDDNMKVDALPASCKRQVIRPDPDEAISQNQATLTDEFFNDPAGTDMSKIFATKLEITCQAQG
ncbi:DUF1007 family protein [Mesorhizobium sp. J428]|uniref:DUF1007 family protein n=1 Tax=Mesorhizobium sp. J428 TaxID=2898440 RepID=UPI002151CD6E|nr:DUF1007 family protein [Mesorhizobium sp. J428]MCR5855903.1 DUF1007 family protein [Mesorhizobium sp. J428]